MSLDLEDIGGNDTSNILVININLYLIYNLYFVERIEVCIVI